MVVSYNHPVRKAWEYVPIILSIYNAFMIPYEFSFVIPFYFQKFNEIINIILDLLFLFDNGLMFFTTRRIFEGETSDHYEIFLSYT